MVVVIGAGAAGLMAAIFAAGAGAQVLLLERTADGGRKILISGGGRCNVLPSALAPERFVTESPPALVRRLLRAWPLAAQRRFFEDRLGVALALEEQSGKLFPASNRARDVRDALVDEARRVGVRFQPHTSVTGLEPGDRGWRIVTEGGTMTASRVVVATGGLSVPATGSDGAGLAMVERLGHRVHAPYPALTPLLADPPLHAGLSGVSLSVRVRARHAQVAAEASGGFLFTHRGYSGPAVLDVSHVAVRSRRGHGPPAVVRVQWGSTSVDDWSRQLAPAPGLVATVVARRLPQRLVHVLMDETAVPAGRRLADLRRDERGRLIERLTSYVLPWTGDEGYRKAEVTGGGVALDELDPATLESRRTPGLFLCGEILDAFGPIGGHNFAWAFSTGRQAGLGAAGGAG
jgi:predicted Rossmann fold flavoprotein